MQRTRTRPLVSSLLACGLLAAFAAGAAAGPGPAIGPGDMAPDFEGKEFFNTDGEPTSLGALRGRIILFELFSTG